MRVIRFTGLVSMLFSIGLLISTCAFTNQYVFGDDTAQSPDKSTEAAPKQQTEGAAKPISLTITPIGKVVKSEGKTWIVLEEKYAPGLLGLDNFSHLNVFWWFSNNDTPQRRSILQVHPRGNPNNPLTGVFATRSPVRPNLIALTRCKILKVEKNRIELDKIDAFDGTPVIDLKPYIPGYDSLPEGGDRDAKLPSWSGNQPPKTGSGDSTSK